MLVEVDKINDWEQVLSTVDKDQVPIHCVKKVIFKLKGAKQKTINLERLR